MHFFIAAIVVFAALVAGCQDRISQELATSHIQWPLIHVKDHQMTAWLPVDYELWAPKEKLQKL